MKTRPAKITLFLLLAAAILPASAMRRFERQDGIPKTVEFVNSDGRVVVFSNLPEEFGGLSWMWSEEGFSPDLRPGSEPTAREPRFFRRSVQLAAPLPKLVRIVAAGAGVMTFRVNGKVVAEGLKPLTAHQVQLTGDVQAGENVFGIEVDNSKEKGSASGLIGRLIFEYEDGRIDIIPIDRTWQVSGKPESGWDAPGAKVTGWKSPILIGPYGISPFAQVSGPLIPPPDFPRITSTGFERPMELLREMSLRYYRYGLTATYKDVWMPEACIWIGMVDPGEYNRNEFLLKRGLLETRRYIDEEGYVATDQHVGLGHPHGWPFPFWMQASGAGWPFSFVGLPYLERSGIKPADPKQWQMRNVQVVARRDPEGARLRLTAPNAFMDSPPTKVDPRVSPFFSIEWSAGELAGKVTPTLEWITAEDPHFSERRSVPFKIDRDEKGRQRSVATLYKHPEYNKGNITGFRIRFGNTAPGELDLRLAFTTQDTRHNGNNAQFIGGVYDVFAYTGDTEWLRAQMPRVRKALKFALDEFQIRELKHVRDPWIGHEGRSGIEYVDGKKVLRRDRGMGNNFWDLLPFGGNDFYTSMLMFVALQRMANLEELVAKHPEWSLNTPDAFDPADLRKLAGEMKEHGNEYFWNAKTGRFPSAIDFDGKMWDYGFTFSNLEAVYYGFANDEHARQIMEWITGVRNVEGDTSQGADIYHWRFAPRATTLRNIDYYKYVWTQPERITFGDQVQDGGAVLGFSFHDLMARQRVMGPDVAWERLLEILSWYEEVWAAGGYMPYYEDHEGVLQSPEPGGLGLHSEFSEPLLMPLFILRGLFGWDIFPDGFLLDPHFPKAVRDFRLDRIRFQGALFALDYRNGAVTVELQKGSAAGLNLRLPAGDWEITYLQGDRPVGTPRKLQIATGTESVPLTIDGSDRLRITGRSQRVVELESQMAQNAERWARRPPTPLWSVGEPIRRFDFGPPDSAEPDWTAAGKDAYTPQKGFGWETPPDELVSRSLSEVKSQQRTKEASNDMRDRSMAVVKKENPQSAVFRVDLDPGSYEILLAAGDVAAPIGAEAILTRTGEEIIAGRVASPGSIVVAQRKVEVPDGILRITIPSPRIKEATGNAMNWLEIRPAKRLQ